jgi:CRP-like cAMP-binding protein
MPIFDELDYADLENLSKLLEIEHFQANQVVFNEGDRGDKFYIIESGRLLVTQRIDGSWSNYLAMGPVHMWEIALLQDGIRTATISPGRDHYYSA